MDFKDAIKQVAERVATMKDSIQTEEATKNALIMPFIAALGYDVFNPTEVVPEMVCDIGSKKGEKIDYAIYRDGQPVILIECKHWKQDLNLHDNQLLRYFGVSKARFGILTNGITYRFYTDLAKENIMDEKPFLEVDMSDLRDNQIEELKKFHKSYFDIDAIMSSASELKYANELKTIINREFQTPGDDFVKFFGKQVYDGVFTAKTCDQFRGIVKRSIASYINDIISDRLKAAIKDGEAEQEAIQQAQAEEAAAKENKIVTTEEELQGFYIVRSLLLDLVPSESIIYRDSMTRFTIFWEKNRAQAICRFESTNNIIRQIVIQNTEEDGKNFVHKIESVDEIAQYAEELRKSLFACMNRKGSQAEQDHTAE